MTYIQSERVEGEGGCHLSVFQSSPSLTAFVCLSISLSVPVSVSICPSVCLRLCLIGRLCGSRLTQRPLPGQISVGHRGPGECPQSDLDPVKDVLQQQW